MSYSVIQVLLVSLLVYFLFTYFGSIPHRDKATAAQKNATFSYIERVTSLQRTAFSTALPNEEERTVIVMEKNQTRFSSIASKAKKASIRVSTAITSLIRKFRKLLLVNKHPENAIDKRNNLKLNDRIEMKVEDIEGTT